MNKLNIKIDNIPAIILGESSNKVYIFVHGKYGCKEEAEDFAKYACKKGWQVLGIDLPEHGERKNEKNSFDPWHIVPELKKVMEYSKKHWSHFAIRANSIGAWFCMLSFADTTVERCLFVSPVLDMKVIIENMMNFASVSKEQLKKEKEIQTSFGETISWQYYYYVKEHPINSWKIPTAILYGDKDNLTSRNIVDFFVKKFSCDLTIMEDGEHWFHTKKQLTFLENWMEEII